MRERVWKYREGTPQPGSEETIGCILLQQPFFFREEDWIPVSDWQPSIVQGKGYDSSEGRGREIWNEVQGRLHRSFEVDDSVTAETERDGRPQVILPRLGQGSFRLFVADSYNRACALSSSHILHILDSAHIKPYALGGSHSPTNGILLRQDIHTLFDRGYLTVTPEYKVEVSNRIRQEFNNGDDYYAMHGRTIDLPALQQLRPSREMLSWHNERVFRP